MTARRGTELRKAAALVLLAVVSGAGLRAALPERRPPHPASPQKRAEGSYLGSGACRSCHPSEHASAQKTFHRSMTRRPDELSWDGQEGPLLPAHLRFKERDFRLTRRAADGSIRYFGPDLHEVGRALARVSRQEDTSVTWKQKKAGEVFRSAREVERELVLVTGSHHYLAFWIEGGHDADLRQFPFVYLLDEERFLPREEAFLQPPDALPYVARWNSNCIQCHTVAGQPNQTEGHDAETGEFWEKYDSSVVDLGITCEACHGPGRQHANYYRDPVRRAAAHGAKQSDDSSSPPAQHIFVPRPEKGANSSATCGQCHSFFVPNDPEEWWESGFSESYQAGQSLAKSRTVLSAFARAGEGDPEGANLIDHDLRTIFWEDGSIIVGGREYNGLTESPCYERGQGNQKLACTSCHSMHKGNPDQQIDPEKKGDNMCTACHADVGLEHSRHEPDSPGARCVNCHMPRTSYALLHGIPSHKISSPSMKMERPPNACSLCHVDRSAAWIGKELAEFGAAPAEGLPAELPLAVERALSGNAAERALYAYALGTDEAALTASGKVADLLLPRLEKDPYAAVRLIAERAKKKLTQARTREARSPRAPNLSLLSVSETHLSELEKRRDNTPIIVSE